MTNQALGLFRYGIKATAKIERIYIAISNGTISKVDGLEHFLSGFWRNFLRRTIKHGLAGGRKKRKRN